MAKELIMPKLGNSVETVVIREWHKEPGDMVRKGETLCEVETDKTTMAVESDGEGVLLARLFEVNDEVSVLGLYAILGEKGEDVSGMISEAEKPQAGAVTEQAGSQTLSGQQTATIHSSIQDDSGRSEPPPKSFENTLELTDAGSDVPAISPRARKLAASRGLQALQINGPGSGPGGRVIEADVQAILKDMPRLTPAARKKMMAHPSAFSATPASSRKEWETIPVKGIRKVIAERMHKSLAESAQLTLNSKAPANCLLRLRSIYKESPPEWNVAGITINNLLMFAVAQTLPAHPQVNAHYLGIQGEIRQFHSVHLGFAVDSPRGLMVPVIRDAHRLGLAALSRESRRLAEACREGSITTDELAGSTFTVSNLGMFGVEYFTPVINPPEVAILGLGAIREQNISLSLSFDHQALDGAPAARFLQNLTTGLSHLEWLLASQEVQVGSKF